MTSEKKLEPMPDFHFKCMMWLYKLADPIWNPRRHIKKIPIKEGMVVVDYGCGPGRFTIPAAKLVGRQGRVFAVDIHPLAIKVVKEKAARKSLTNIETMLLDSYNTGIKGSSVDLILLIDALHMITDHHALFREMHRLLKQDGIIFMDAEHMKKSRAVDIVESTGLFTIVERRGKDMLVAPKAER
ncbi:SAM-dependent methyltransferase [bacterium (candidate division B38) B3_B38]|nr:MAG: SAM-dependent methyltransferase [bacterium (candidate division B38) B3_B38]